MRIILNASLTKTFFFILSGCADRWFSRCLEDTSFMYAYKEDALPDEINGIDLRDQELGSEFNSEPRLYGNVTIDEEERSVLSLPPRFGIMKKVDVTDTTIEVEKCLNTMRWREIIGEEEETHVGFYNETENEMDINRMRPTDFCLFVC